MASHRIELRQATAADVPQMAHVDADSWPAPLAGTEEQIRSRVAVFPEGQWVALVDGLLVAQVFAQRISQQFFDRGPLTFDRLTDAGTFARSHDPHGELFQVIGVGVSTAGRGFGLGRRLVDREIEFGRSLPGVRRVLGFTRPVQYHRHAEMPIEEYVRREKRAGRPLDPVLAFHLMAGAKLVSIHAGFRPADAEAKGYGLLIEYP
jgi:hypothetical protein